MLPLVLPSVATLLPVSGNTKNGVIARKTKVKIYVLPMLPNIIYFSYVISSLSLSLSSLLFHFFSYKLYFFAATAATAATWRHYAIRAATLAATKFDELATEIWDLDVVNRVIKPFVWCCQ